MMTPPQDTSKKEICTIRIMFPVNSDEEAIECKKKISEVLKDKSDALVEFRLSTAPPLK